MTCLHSKRARKQWYWYCTCQIRSFSFSRLMTCKLHETKVAVNWSMHSVKKIDFSLKPSQQHCKLFSIVCNLFGVLRLFILIVVLLIPLWSNKDKNHLFCIRKVYCYHNWIKNTLLLNIWLVLKSCWWLLGIALIWQVHCYRQTPGFQDLATSAVRYDYYWHHNKINKKNTYTIMLYVVQEKE